MFRIGGWDPGDTVVARLAKGVGRERIEGAPVCTRPAEETRVGGARCRESLEKVRTSSKIAPVMRRLIIPGEEVTPSQWPKPVSSGCRLPYGLLALAQLQLLGAAIL
ncbi:hypothetical protein NDU88_004912 [Pleurodeles waltl]|uniref:Uncharacterized protein n=1 Tax=Pleurodeles waltl TaxID=8319 RepID=A0AAV7UGJ2_PLEWA|nr:hypothetical protein NDU88_004912 [Pleurodeles waltl]